MSKKAIIGTTIALGGILVLFGGDLIDNPGNFKGNFYAFVAGVLAGLYYLSGRKLRRTISLPTYAFVVYLFSLFWLYCYFFHVCFVDGLQSCFVDAALCLHLGGTACLTQLV